MVLGGAPIVVPVPVPVLGEVWAMATVPISAAARPILSAFILVILRCGWRFNAAFDDWFRKCR